MASKARGGLSKGEFQRAQAAKVKPVVKKISPQKSTSKPAPLYGAGPLMPGQKRVANSYGGDKNVPSLVGAGPLLPGQKRVQPEPKKTPSLVNKNITKNTNKKSNRSLASKALGLLTGAGTAQATSGEPSGNTDFNKVSLSGDTTRKGGGIVEMLGKVTDPFGIKGKLRSRGIDLPQAPDFGITEALGLTKSVPTGFASYKDEAGKTVGAEDQLAMYDYSQFQDQNQDSPLDANTFVNNRKQGNQLRSSGDFAPYATTAPRSTFQPSVPKNNYEQDYEKTLQDEMSPVKDYLNLSSSPVGPVGPVNPADAPLADTPGGTVAPRSGRGSGLFATGKGVGNPAGPEDEYLSMLRKSMKGYGNQEEDVMRQFKNLIKSLDPTYDEYQKEGQKTLEQELQRNLTQLAAVMNSNNTGDSEQRAQMMAGLQRDNQNSLGDLVRKLMLQKNEDIQGYKTKSVDAVNSIRDKKMTAQQSIAKAIQDYKQQQWENQYKMSSTGSKSKGKTGVSSDAAFEKEAKKLQQQILMGRINRDAAARSLASSFPEYDENVIYDLVPDNYNM